MDERVGVGVARRNGLRATGTLGILDEAVRQGWLDLAIAIEKLRATTFRYPQSGAGG
jgi:predicted nucleic acid-binding protein